MLLVGSISAVVAVVSLVAGTVTIGQLASVRRTVIDELDPALLNTQLLVGGLLNQETAVRGYALTGDPSFLQPDEQGLRQQEAATAALRQVAEAFDGPGLELGRALDDVLERSRVWRVEYADPTIAAVRAGGPAAAARGGPAAAARGGPAAAADPVAGKVRFDAVRAALDVQRTRLADARRIALADLRAAATALTVTAVCIAIGLGSLLIGLAVWIHRTVSVPISRLAETVRAVAGGEFERRPTGTGPKDIVELASDVDSMRARILTELHVSQALNAALNRQAEELGRSNRDLEQFAYVASHDLQEPLRKVSGFCELLRTRYGGQLDDRADQYIDFAVDGARRMSRLINDLLAFSRVGRTPMTREQVSSQTLLDQALRNLATQVAETGAEVTHDRMPTVFGESTLLVTVFQNLIGNAIKFHGEQPPKVHVEAVRRDDLWEFRVSDNGIGVDPAYADKVFVIFQRLHAKEEYPGTGIGLALCRKILEYHGGSIWLDPEPATGTGTTFCFTLPTVDAPARRDDLVPAARTDTADD